MAWKGKRREQRLHRRVPSSSLPGEKGELLWLEFYCANNALTVMLVRLWFIAPRENGHEHEAPDRTVMRSVDRVSLPGFYEWPYVSRLRTSFFSFPFLFHLTEMKASWKPALWLTWQLLFLFFPGWSQQDRWTTNFVARGSQTHL